MSFSRGATPTFVLSIPKGYEDFNAVENITVSLTSNGAETVKDGEAVTILSENEIEVTLTQEESLAMRGTTVEIQINWTYPDTELRGCTKICYVSIDRQLHMEVIR